MTTVIECRPRSGRRKPVLDLQGTCADHRTTGLPKVQPNAMPATSSSLNTMKC